MIRLLALLCLLLLRAETATGPSRLLGPAASDLFASRATLTLVASQDTGHQGGAAYPLELGLVIRGVAGGLALGLAGYGLCHDDQEVRQSCFGPAAGGAALGAAVGGTVGALVGGLFPKHQNADSLAMAP